MKRPLPVCFVQQTQEAIGGKWRIYTVHALSSGHASFSALERAIPSISERMLALQLKELLQDGLIERTIENERPLRVSYAFTPLGETLVPFAAAFYEWGRFNGQRFVANRRSSANERVA